MLRWKEIMLFGMFLATTLHASNDNCHIRVGWTENGGKKQSMTFGTHLETADQCRRLARLHQPNFDPERMRAKKVGFHWGLKKARAFSKV